MCDSFLFFFFYVYLFLYKINENLTLMIIKLVVFLGFYSWSQASIQKPWDDGLQTLDSYKRRLRAAFEFYSKIGKYFVNIGNRST